jgi:DNA (cytosine-5)-methyltransferase 1
MTDSDITVTDLFCGAGGSSTGAADAGARIRMALNHWDLAIRTHNENHPQADHDCTDISACNPNRYPSTTILIASPECVNHSLSKGVKRKSRQLSLLPNGQPDPAAERSRATMWDVVRFTERHRYQLVIVENVVEAHSWELYEEWIAAMRKLGYESKEVFLNSQFCWPTPQSRDRMYVVFWRKGNRAPDLDYRPLARCEPCDQDVHGVQCWKNPMKPWGKYKQQYVYRCPRCATQVHPYYYGAYTAIDWSIQAERIGDRRKPLAANTLARIRYGLEKYGTQANLIKLAHSANNPANYVRPVERPFATQTGCHETGLAVPPMMVVANYSPGYCKPASEPLGSITTRDHHGVVALPFIDMQRANSAGSRIDQELPTICAGGRHHGLVVPPGTHISSYYSNDKGHAITDALGTISTVERHSLVTAPPFIASYYGGRHATQLLDEPLPTVPGMKVHYLTQPGQVPEVEDCTYRMLAVREIGAGMAFPADYVVYGTQDDQVKQLGNAVTPPVMRWLSGQCIASLS